MSSASAGRTHARAQFLFGDVGGFVIAFGVSFDGPDLEQVGAGSSGDHLGDDHGVAFLNDADIVLLAGLGEHGDERFAPRRGQGAAGGQGQDAQRENALFHVEPLLFV